MREAREHPLAVALAKALREQAEMTGEPPPEGPLVVPKAIYRAIAEAANDTALVNLAGVVALELEIDEGCRRYLQPEGWIAGVSVPWRWLMRGADPRRNL